MGRHAAMFSDKTRTRKTSVLLKVLWYYLSNHARSVIIVAILTLFYTAAVTIQPLLVERAINMLLVDRSFSVLNILIILYIALAVLGWVAQSLITWVMAKVQNDLVHDIRSDTFEKLVEADFSYHASIQSGNVTSRVINDTQEITNGLNVFTTSLTNILVAVATLVVLFSISIWFGLISLLAIPTAIIITSVISSKGKARMLKVRSSLGKVSGTLAENLAGVSIAKSFNQEERTSNEIRKLNDETYEHFKQLGAMMTMIFPSITLVSMVMIGLIVLVGGYLYEEALVTIGSIYLGTVMVRRFLSPILALSNNITNLQASLAALDRVTDVLQTEPSVRNARDAVPLDLKGGEIVFEHVSFSYAARGTDGKMSGMMAGRDGARGMPEGARRMPEGVRGRDGGARSMQESARGKHGMQGGTPGGMGGAVKPTGGNGKVMPPVEQDGEGETKTLDDVSFTIPAGKKTALVGKTGAGKSTITKLILRFYDPTEGSIRIDGMDLREITLESLYDSVSLVSQEPYLFMGTVMENIKYGRPDATDEEVYEICEMLGADEFIDALPDGYQTVLSESGKSLSAGQRQMITIARTMLRDPKILILDEATSRLDAFTESLVQEAQRKLFEGRTTLVIAHRLSTIRDVDQIIVIDGGKIIEVGSHDELMALKGKYFELYNTYYAHQGIAVAAD